MTWSLQHSLNRLNRLRDHLLRRYATLGNADLGNYNGTADSKAARSSLPPVDSIDMWPFIESMSSNGPTLPCPRRQAILSGSHRGDGALIAVHPHPITGADTLFKLIRSVAWLPYVPSAVLGDSLVAVVVRRLLTQPCLCLVHWCSYFYRGFQVYGDYPGIQTPNSSARTSTGVHCGSGQLYDLTNDPVRMASVSLLSGVDCK